MSQRLSRKEIKRNELAQAVERTVEYATSHTRTLWQVGIGAAAVLVLGAGTYLFLDLRARSARTDLDAAIRVAQAPIEATAAKPDDPERPTFADEASRRSRARALFEQVRSRHGGAPAAVALAYLGRFAAEEGSLDRARELWQESLAEAADHLLAAEVRLNLLKLDLAQGKAEEVARRLEAMLEQTEKPLPEDVILFELAAVREKLGKTDEALAAYQRIVDEFPRSPYLREAQQKAGALANAA
jgi:tetratricopeptide (TPR) repeat protein